MFMRTGWALVLWSLAASAFAQQYLDYPSVARGLRVFAYDSACVVKKCKSANAGKLTDCPASVLDGCDVSYVIPETLGIYEALQLQATQFDKKLKAFEKTLQERQETYKAELLEAVAKAAKGAPASAPSPK